MFNPVLKQLADEYSLWYRDDVAYGAVKGCFLSIRNMFIDHGYRIWRIYIYIGPFQQNNPAALLKNAESVFAHVKREATDIIYSVIEPSPHLGKDAGLRILENDSIVQIDLIDHRHRGHSSIRPLRAFIENILPSVAAHTAPNLCACCGHEILPADKLFVLTGKKKSDSPDYSFLPCGAVVPTHASCSESARQTTEKAIRTHHEKQRQDERKERIGFIILLLIVLLFLLLGKQ